MEMKKSDLKTGMVVELRNGAKYMVLLNTPFGDVLVRNRWWVTLDNFNFNLLHCAHDFDILRIYRPEEVYQIGFECWGDMKMMWERGEPKKMTLADVEDALGYPVEIVEEVK